MEIAFFSGSRLTKYGENMPKNFKKTVKLAVATMMTPEFYLHPRRTIDKSFEIDYIEIVVDTLQPRIMKTSLKLEVQGFPSNSISSQPTCFLPII